MVHGVSRGLGRGSPRPGVNVIRARRGGVAGARLGELAAGWSIAILLAALSAGCATQPGAGPAAGGTRDIVTASDEPEARKRAGIRMELATGYFGQGKLTTALDELKQAIALDPSLPGAFSLRGAIYDALGDDLLAEESFRRALEINPADTGAMHNYGWFLCKRRRFDAADTWFARAVETPMLGPRSQSWAARGICQSRSGRLADAQASLLHAYEIDAANPITGVNLANVLHKRGEYERARFYIRRVNSQEGLSNAETLWLALRIERRLGNKEEEAALAAQLHARFPTSREAAALDAGRFED